MIVCPNCGTENPERARFCLECATPLAAAPAKSRGVRKLVTVLFADAVGSTALGEQIDPETMRGALSRSFAVAKEVLERHGGTVEKFIGDAVMAVFGIPVLHEDDALRAVRAAAELRDRLTALDRELEAERGLRIQFRIGVNTGEVVAGGADASASSLVTGDAVNTAARLEQAAPAGEILIGELTRRLVQDRIAAEPVEPIEAKGKAEPLRALRLVSVETAESETGYRRLSARMVGRERELRRLSEAFDDIATQRRCHLFTLLGAAGVGKSRLVAEFLARIDERATVVRGRCLPYGEGITYWPIGEIVRTAAGFEETDDADGARSKLDGLLTGEPEAARIAALVASAIGLSAEAAPREEVLWAVRRLLERLAREHPVVCVIDDIHWAEATLLDLIEYVADWSRDAAILLVCSARPELLEERPTWAGGKLNATTVLLEALSADLTRELVLDLLDSPGLPEAITTRILDTAEGNPLFAEEIVRMLVDEGLLSPSSEGWVADERLQAVPMPTSVQAVIAARLDRLPPSERTVAERAAVVGRVFERAAVAELVPDELRDEVPARLLALVRKELVRPDRSDLSAEDAFRFRHLLIRDTAYEGIPKEERAELHERFAAWVERVAGERIAEFREIVGYHYEQAQRYRSELGLLDGRTRELAERAGRHLTEAGRRAYLHGDPEAAVKLQLRGLPLVPPGTERRDALFMLAFAAQEVARWGEARDAVAQLLREPSLVGDEVFELKARLLDHMVRLWTDPTWSAEEALALAAGAIPVFEARNDHQGLAIAYRAESYVHLGAERWAECRRASERALTHAIAIGERPLEEESREMIVGAILFGPTPLDEVLGVAAEQLAAISSRLPRAHVLNHLALAYAWLGDPDEARAHARECRRIRAEVEGDAKAIVFSAGWVEQVLGDLAAAEEELRRTADILETLGETGLRATIVGSLAHVLFELQRPDEEVLAQVELTRQLAAADDAEAQSSWRITKALVEARAVRFDEAERLAGEAIDIRSRTDAIVGQANLRVDRAWIREHAGRLDDARRDLEEALALFEQKGALIEIPRVRERLAALGEARA